MTPESSLCPQRSAALLARPWWQIVLAVALLAILVIEIAGMAGTKVIVPLAGAWKVTLPAGDRGDTIEGRFVRWDSNEYLRVARDGYRVGGEEAAFFPLYSLAMRHFSAVSGLSLMWSGLLISVAAFLVACLLLYQWAALDYSPQTARWAVLWLCFFPMSFFLVATYAESLFLAAAVASLYLARRGHFLASGVAIALAGATRPPAFLLTIPYVIEFVLQRDFFRRRTLSFVLGALVAPVGTLLYLAAQAAQAPASGLLAPFTSQQAGNWQRWTTWPWVTLWDGLRSAVLGTGVNPGWFTRAIAWQNLVFSAGAVALAACSLLLMRGSASAYFVASMIFFLSTHGQPSEPLMSMPRWVAGIPPLYLCLALIGLKLPARVRWLALAASAVLLVASAAAFTSGRWIA